MKRSPIIFCEMVVLIMLFPTIGKATCSSTSCDYSILYGSEGIWPINCPSCGVLQNVTYCNFYDAVNEGDYHYHRIYCQNCGYGPFKVSISRIYVSSNKPPDDANYDPLYKPVQKVVDDYFASCFIATAAYENPYAPEVEILRNFRNIYLLPNPLTNELVNFYYFVSPSLAHTIEKSKILKIATRIYLTPIVAAIYPFVIMPETFVYLLKNNHEKEKVNN